MNCEITQRIWEIEFDSTRDKFVALAMAHYADPDTGESYVSARALSGATLYSVRTVMAALKSLAEKKIVQRQAQFYADGGAAPNRYRFAFFTPKEP